MDFSMQGQKQPTGSNIEPSGAPGHGQFSEAVEAVETTHNINNANAPIPISTNIQCLESQSYREMLQKMKKLNQTLEELEDQVSDLQCRWAETHLKAATLFDPEVAQILRKFDTKN